MQLTFTEEGYQDINLTNADICSEEMSFEDALWSDENMRVGACESGCFKIRVVNSNSFKGKELTVNIKILVDDDRYLIDAQGNRIVTDNGDYIIVNVGKKDDIIHLGKFKVYSDEPTNDRMWRDLVCYDYMHDILNVECSDFYNQYKPYLPMTLQNFRNLFFGYLMNNINGFSGQTEKVLPNDNFEVDGGFIAEGSLSGKTIIEAICELNGCFGHMNSDGYFDYISLNSNNDSITPKWYINDESGKYEDYTVDAITGVIARSEASDIGTSVGTDVNPLIIEGNPLIYGKEGTTELTTALTNIFNNVKDISYRPFTINTYGNPALPVGTNITINTKKYDTQNGYQPFVVNSIVQNRVLTGIQGMVDSYSATGTQQRGYEANSLQSQIIRTAGKVHKVQVDLDNFISEIEDADYATKINQNAQAIELESKRAQSQEEIYGVVESITKLRDPIYEQGSLWQRGAICLNSNIEINRSLVAGMRLAVWVKDMGESTYNDDYDRFLQISIRESASDYPLYHAANIYYTNDEALRTQYKNGVVLHLLYRINEQFPLSNGRYKYLSGWWIGADDSLARLQITADSITSYVGNNFVSNATYNAEIQNLQDQIDGRVEYWDGNVVPTLTNLPASNWTTDADKSSHVGDLYRYHHGTPEVTDYYRFDKNTSTTPATYSWVALGASEVDEALRLANEANAKADAAQSQLDDFEASTAGNFSQVNQTISGVTTTVSGIQKREVQNNTFSATTETYSTDGIIYKLNTALSEVNDNTRLSILLQSIPWDTTETAKKRYIKINDETTEIGVNTFPVYYSKDTPLTNQLGLGNVLNVKFYSNYNTTGSTTESAFVVSNNDRTYERLESELSVERGRIVLRAENTSPVSGGGYKGRLAIARLDSTGSSSELYLSADNIKLEAGDGMKLLAGQTLTLSGANGLVINSPNFNVYRDGSVSVTGTIYATSGRFTGEIQSTSGKIGGFDISSAGLSQTIGTGSSSYQGFRVDGGSIYFATTGNVYSQLRARDLDTPEVICNSISKKSGLWGNINADLNTALTNIDSRLVSATRAVSYLGIYQSADTDGEVSVSSGTNKSIAQIDLDNGVWIIIARTNFASNTTGDRLVMINTSKDSDSGRGQSAVRLDAISGNATQIITTRIVTTGGRYYMTVSQDSGSNLMCSGGITAVRLK